MRARLLRLHSPDVDLATFAPADSSDVGVLVQMMIGPDGGPGEESFDVVVCTPVWLARHVLEGGPVSGRHHVIVPSWDMQSLREFLQAAVEGETGADWSELTARLARLGRWEFEDYQP